MTLTKKINTDGMNQEDPDVIIYNMYWDIKEKYQSKTDDKSKKKFYISVKKLRHFEPIIKNKKKKINSSDILKNRVKLLGK